MSRPLARRERIAWARLARAPGVGPLTFQNLIARFRSADAALEALPPSRSPPTVSAIERELDALQDMGATLLASCEPAYPELLRALDPGPAMIAARGELQLLHKPTVALVGAREASGAGLKLAADFARELGALGYVTVSGLARGIDARVHEASIATGTVAVLAGGLDKPYPPQNRALYERLCAEALVISEAPLGFQARARDFPRRNHIISGLSLGVVVIEAAVRSGSLITARAAAEQGRDVMAVPGSPLDPRARGGNALLKQGAILVETPEDVAEALRATPVARSRTPTPVVIDETPPQGLVQKVARLLSPTPLHLNDLARLAAAPVGAVAAALTELELEGRAATLAGGYAASPGAAFGGEGS